MWRGCWLGGGGGDSQERVPYLSPEGSGGGRKVDGIIAGSEATGKWLQAGTRGRKEVPA